MPVCLQAIVDSAGKIQSIVGQISCNPAATVSYFDWSNTGFWVVFGAVVLLIIILWSLVGYPRYHVWSAQKSGEADLAAAHKDQQIQVAKAQGRFDAAALNKQAAVVEAEAVSAQIETIGTKLTEHDLYLKWQWIKMMEERPDSSVIYVPTEAGLPILEALRLNKTPQANGTSSQE